MKLALEELQRLGLAERREAGGLRVTVPDARYLAEVSAVALLLWKPALLETEFMTDTETATRVISALHHMLSLIDDGQPEDGAVFTAAFFDVFTPIVELTGNRVWLTLHKALQTRAAHGVRGFTDAIDVAGIRAWASTVEAALTAQNQRALYEAFAALSSLSSSFADVTSSRPA